MAARTGKASLVGLIGQPVTHSLSPAIHEYWMAQHGIDGTYIPFRHAPGAMPELLRALRTLDLRGFNITVPYKSEMLAHLDSIDPEAKAVGAVNTVVVEKGRWHGLNTDGSGYLRHLQASTSKAQLQSCIQESLVLGGGGAARSIVAALMRGGAQHLTVCNRSYEKACALISHLQPLARGTRLSALPWERRQEAVPKAGLLVNTTSLGMEGHAPLELSLDAMPAGGIVSDIVYAPLETPLLAKARARGLTPVEGLGMLLGQAAEAFHAWFGVMPEVTPKLRAHVLAMREAA
jgi:shikimate dehydrogenase